MSKFEDNTRAIVELLAHGLALYNFFIGDYAVACFFLIYVPALKLERWEVERESAKKDAAT